MLLETRKQFGLLKNFAQIVEGMRLDAESKATSLSPIDKHALFLELFVDKEEGVAARQKFSNAEDRLYEDFESKMSAINRILFPLNTGLVEKSTVKLGKSYFTSILYVHKTLLSKIIIPFCSRSRCGAISVEGAC